MTGRNVTFGLQGSGVKNPVWCLSDSKVRKVGAAELRESRRPKNEDQLSFRGCKAVSLAFVTFCFLKGDSNFIFFYILIFKKYIFIILGNFIYCILTLSSSFFQIHLPFHSHQTLCPHLKKRLVLPINSWVCDCPATVCSSYWGPHTQRKLCLPLPAVISDQ